MNDDNDCGGSSRRVSVKRLSFDCCCIWLQSVVLIDQLDLAQSGLSGLS